MDLGEDPLLDALAGLREIDQDYLDAHPDTANAELHERMMFLFAAVTALDELRKRDEAADAEAIREEMIRLGDGFAHEPDLLRELAEGFLEHGDRVNGETLARAYAWFMVMAEQNDPRRN